MSQKVVNDNDLRKVVDAIVTCYRDRAKLQRKEEQQSIRILVALAGRPGSGKTTVANVIAAELEKKMAEEAMRQQNSNCQSKTKNYEVTKNVHGNDAGPLPARQVCVMSMDGYHLYRSELRAMKNAEEAIRRRGAEWTFDPIKLCKDLKALKEFDTFTGHFAPVQVPSFNHGVGDPVERDITIPPEARIVIVEGNYVLYRDKKEWADVYSCFDLHVFLYCDRAVCTERLCRRHMNAWNISRDAAMTRASGSDSINGDLVDTTMVNADVIIHSREMSSLSPRNSQQVKKGTSKLESKYVSNIDSLLA